MIDDDFQPLPEEEERRIGALVRDLPPPAADPTTISRSILLGQNHCAPAHLSFPRASEDAQSKPRRKPRRGV